MSTRQLPQQANLRQLRRQAKDLHKSYRSGDPEAISRVRESVGRLADQSDESVRAAGCSLQDIQYVIAAEYGFDDWAHLRREVEAMSGDRLGIVQQAIRSGDSDTVRKELERDPSIVHRRREENDATLLHIASSEKQAGIAQILIDAGADLEATCGEGWRPLHNAAAQSGSVAVLEVLLEAGADPASEACGSGGTPIVHALFYGCSEEARVIAKHSIEPANLRVAAGLGMADLIRDLVGEDGALDDRAGQGRTFYRHHEEFPEWTPSDEPQEILDEALCYAAHNGALEAVDVLVARGANPSSVPYDAGPLHKAVNKGDREMVERLLAHGADPTVRDKAHGGRAYDWCPYGPNPDLIHVLLEAGAEHDLYAAVRLGRTERVTQLAKGASAGELRSFYRTAIECGHESIAEILVEGGVELNLFDLIELGQADAVKALLADGGDPNAVRQRGVERMGSDLIQVEQSGLQAAASAGQVEIGHTLAKAGAEIDLHAAAFLGLTSRVEDLVEDDVDRIDEFGLTALHRAIQGDAVESARRLIELGASVETSSDTFTFGGKAIHVAAQANASPAMIDLLIEAGADVNQRMNPGTPLEVAERRGKSEVAKVLRGRGAVG